MVADDADRQLFEDELRRCEVLSTTRYYAERGRVLEKLGVDRAVAFLREEALAALTGENQHRARVNRWFILARLDKFGDVEPSYAGLVRMSVVSLVAQAVQQAEMTDVYATIHAITGKADDRPEA